MVFTPAEPLNPKKATLLWFDPGVTTGICCATINPAWLRGDIPPSWETLGGSITYSWFCQVGRNEKSWSTAREKSQGSISLRDRELFRAPKEFRRKQRQDPGEAAGSFEEILQGQGAFGGGALRPEYVEDFEQLNMLQNLLETWPNSAWGYEDFIPRKLQMDRDFLAPVRIFSALTYSEIAHGTHGRLPFVQQPAMAKTTASDQRLKMAKMYRPGMPHANDAARHVLTFFRRARAQETLRIQAWPHLFGSEIKEFSPVFGRGDVQGVGYERVK